MLKLKILWAWDFDILHGIQKTDSCNSSRGLIFNKFPYFNKISLGAGDEIFHKTDSGAYFHHA